MLKSFRHAWNGIMLAIRSERNVKIQLTVSLSVIMAGIYLKLSAVEWCLAILAMGLVMGLEIMNTAMEELVNFVSPERREEAKRIKDLAAGAVFLAAISATVLAVVLLWSRFST